jgi:peptidoglycan biosynthesis protein MviN/MurJ (putative lipid II flippase)
MSLARDITTAGGGTLMSRLLAYVRDAWIAGSIALLAVFLGRYVIAGIAPGFDDGQQSFAAFLLFMTAPYILLAGLVAVLAAALSAEGRSHDWRSLPHW